MNNPIKLYKDLQTTYLKYLSSGMPFFEPEYDIERKELLKEQGTLCQPPIIEIVPKYKEIATLEQFCKTEQVTTEFADFVNCGLFYNDKALVRRLYKHQYNSLKEAFINHKNIIVTTGTGSGKTECFLLPIIADLVKESKSWKDNRTRAIRTLILYPLNALAEDQMIRLRKALNSRNESFNGALDWLDKNRNGNRFYFGRYTGSTPVSGSGDSAINRLRLEKSQLIEDWTAAKEAYKETGSAELLYHVPNMENDSAEMWDRVSMQRNAPDILITNYSMLNIMLMRNLESSMFDETKKWLKEDTTHIFHLVIDELHTYRGTSGTEVAYLIRILLDRIGLTPDSPQVQFLASSASMRENQQTKDFLCEFFGVNKANFDDKFVIFSNDKEPAQNRPNISIPLEAFEDYSNTSISEKDRENELFLATRCDSYLEISEKYQLVQWLKYSMTDTYGNITATNIINIAKKLGIDEGGESVVSSILRVLCKSQINNVFILPLRIHFFFRAINGLWACSDSGCKCLSKKQLFEGRLFGKFYKNSRSICTCGHNVLEVIICECCGEAFLGGYIVKKGTIVYLSSEKPIGNFECLYGILWKAEGTYENWIRVKYNSFTGEIVKSPHGEYLLHEQVSDKKTKFPEKCPQCEIAYKIIDENSITPLKRHSIGLQKVNQVLADSLVRSMKNENEPNTKVVLFSDSRQAAAKLSAGIELDHYRDVLRWLMLHALKGDVETINFLRKYEPNNAKIESREDFDKLLIIKGQRQYEELIKLIQNKTYGLKPEEEKKLKSLFSSLGNVSLEFITNDVFKGLLSIGANPAGPKPSLANDPLAGDWSSLFDFKQLSVRLGLGDSSKQFYDKIRMVNRQEQIISLFAHKKKSFESMKLGYICCSNTEGLNSQMLQLINSIIRILGEKRRIAGFISRYPAPDSFPRDVRNLVKVIYGIRSQSAQTEKLNEIKSLMRRMAIIDRDKVLLTGEKIAFYKSTPGMTYWICPRCKTIHLQPSNGYCVHCFNKLGDGKILTENDLYDSNDYYLSLVNSTDKIYRMHCEEMTGQTTRTESRKRQRLFQDIFLTTENQLVDGIDMLSVTTTMEAGVDIGSLSTVMMGNVPPQRFNYQQRVGRAGRRGNPISVALTVARGASHDITHYFEPERMVSATPKDPYLEVRIKEIAERIIFKEVLYNALKTNDLNAESVHGSFGNVIMWEQKNKSVVIEWIKKNKTKISHIISVVTRCTDITDKDKELVKKYIENELVDRISDIVSNPEFTQSILSERLANAGLLPMYGFPTRTRNLYLSRPDKLPADNVVNRDMEMAINSFAPGHEIVKDKKVYKAIGVVDYEFDNHHKVVARKNSLNINSKPMFRCRCCGYSTMKIEEETAICPICSNEMEKITVCSPLGFCVDYKNEPQDFNGSFDWYSPNSDIKLDCEEYLTECPRINNLLMKTNYIPTKGFVHIINDNNGKLYRLGQNENNIWVDRTVYPKEIQNSLYLRNEKELAFVLTKTTGILTLTYNNISDQLNLNAFGNVNGHAVRSAFLSWGYLVRKAVASYLDIDAEELEIGYHVSESSHKPEIFIVERLENGSGYCNYLSGNKYKDVPYEAIVMPLLESGNIYELLCSPSHMLNCSSSCYDCIRDYSNQKEHQTLDWRLGLDIAKIISDKNVKIGFDTYYWKSYIQENVNLLLEKQHLTLFEYVNNLYLIRDANSNIVGILVHPLWSEKYIQEITNGILSSVANVEKVSIFDLGK